MKCRINSHLFGVSTVAFEAAGTSIDVLSVIFQEILHSSNSPFMSRVVSESTPLQSGDVWPFNKWLQKLLPPRAADVSGVSRRGVDGQRIQPRTSGECVKIEEGTPGPNATVPRRDALVLLRRRSEGGIRIELHWTEEIRKGNCK